MKLLLDQNISYRVIKKLAEFYPDIQSIKQSGLENSDDFQIWEYAKVNELTIVTFDEDFYKIQILKGFPPKIIWFKTGNLLRREFEEFMIAKHKIISSFVDNKEYDNEGCLEFYFIK